VDERLTNVARVNGVNAAIFSHDFLYRYMLSRVWDQLNDRRVVFIGLNPSTADETEDDPTIPALPGFRAGLGLRRDVHAQHLRTALD
jgi:hypothetical protein